LRYRLKRTQMNEISVGKTINPVAYLFKIVINKFRQQPDIYPIKYYKKNRIHRKNKQSQFV